MLTQCVNFGVNSDQFFEHWTVELPLKADSVDKNPATVSHCDWQEVSDMLDWQAFLGTFEIKDGQPDVVGSGIPLSVILSMQHNLVTYGVPFADEEGQWTNPGPRKTFYKPADAIKKLGRSLSTRYPDFAKVFKKWLKSGPRLDVAGLPGSAGWARTAKSRWASPG